jgi:hypothetical protein
MARPCVARRIAKSDERESCINVSGLGYPRIQADYRKDLIGVKYSPLENFPHDLAIGVANYGRDVRGEWRRVLKDGPAEPVRR